MTETNNDIIRCDACPVLCRIKEGKAGACDRYANVGGKLNRLDPLLVASRSDKLVPFVQQHHSLPPPPASCPSNALS